jgi:hypothetical protein
VTTPRPEKRREVRRPGNGVVHLTWQDPASSEVYGRLVDVSESGFRVSHCCTTLGSGQIVQFSHLEAKGQARVVWTRIVAGQVESGFVVVPF